MRWLAFSLTAVLAATLIAAPTQAAVIEPPPRSEERPVPIEAAQTGRKVLTASRYLRGNQPALMQATSGDSGVGTYKATSLSPSGAWAVAGPSGDFTWSYGFAAPPVPGSLVPELKLAYSSGWVDGRTSTTNNQPSWAGEGWELWPGYIERTYRGCADDGQPTSGDLCWASDNASLSLNGSSGALILGSDQLWHPTTDTGARIERKGSPGPGEHWIVTTTDGTQYFFGSVAEAKSAWTVPVFGDDAGEPCHQGAFANSSCDQVFRWNLDRVLDPRGNVIRYFYETETNNYLRNGTTKVSYIRGGTLDRIDYGLRAGQEGATPLARIDFETAGRCVPGSDCRPELTTNWPDVPFEHSCTDGPCTLVSPTFWATQRLSRISTHVLRAGALSLVDSWGLQHEFPPSGDAGKPGLWLQSITRTGLHPVTFQGVQKPNRVDADEGLAPLYKRRLTQITSETGALTTVTYEEPNCLRSQLPTPEGNKQRCFPQYWQPEDNPALWDWFHKYVAKSIATDDVTGRGKQTVTRYSYLDGGTWHWDDSEFTKDEYRTWNQWRGYGKVRVQTGDSDQALGTVPAVKETSYIQDTSQFSGMLREETTYNGSGVVSVRTEEPWSSGLLASRGNLKSYRIGVKSSQTRTALASGDFRTTRSETTFDEYGMPVKVHDLGDTARPDDDKHTTTTYARNASAWLMNLISRVESTAASGSLLSDISYVYDDTGLVTRVSHLREKAGGGTEPVTVTSKSYDSYGRPVSVTDALGYVSTTAYTGVPVTETVATNPLGHRTTTQLDPARGLPVTIIDHNGKRTDMAYDSLGRLTQVWLPNQNKLTGYPPHMKFAYHMSNTAPSVVISSKLTANSKGAYAKYVDTYAIYDSSMRELQQQSPANGGGRLIFDTAYDTLGRAYKTAGSYYAEGGSDGTLVSPTVDVPAHTETRFDGAGREIAKILFHNGREKWRTTTAYGGDRVHVTLPQGGIATMTIFDAQGQRTELHQAGQLSARYTYTQAGQLETITDAAGAVWRYSYDLRGRQIVSEDPDKGRTTVTYDDAGEPVSTTDARGITLETEYDALGRKKVVRSGDDKLAEWAYDTVAGSIGQLASSTRWINGNAYTVAQRGYTPLYQSTGTEITIPASVGSLKGTYTTKMSYTLTGAQKTIELPAIGGLPAETVITTVDDMGLPLQTSSSAATYVGRTDYTRRGELERVHLGADPKRTWLAYYYEENTRRLNQSVVKTESTPALQADVRYAYDPAGNVLSINDVFSGDDQRFTYDSLRRLATASASGGPSPYQAGWSYDASGNRAAQTGDTPVNYTYSGHRLQQAGPESYAYDAAGNMTSRAGQTLTWDAFGSLETTGSSSFVYTADGNRLLRKDGGATTLYLPGQELRVEADGATAPVRYYSHGGDTVAVRTKAGLSWVAGDHLDTLTVAVDAGTLQATQRRQGPFGTARGAAVAFPGSRGFVGGTIDPATATVHLGAREYDPGLGRFLSVDPVLNESDPQQMNGYTYSNNNPTTYSDPSGLSYCDSPLADPADCGGYNDGGASGGSDPGHDGECGPAGHGSMLACRPESIQTDEVTVLGQEFVAYADGSAYVGGKKVSMEQAEQAITRLRELEAWLERGKASNPLKHLRLSLGGVCFGAGAQVGGAVSGTVCLVIDKHGIGTTETVAAGFGPAVGARVGLGGVTSNNPLEQQTGAARYVDGFNRNIAISMDGKTRTTTTLPLGRQARFGLRSKDHGEQSGMSYTFVQRQVDNDAIGRGFRQLANPMCWVRSCG